MEVNINDFFVFGKSLRLEETALLWGLYDADIA